MGRLVPAHNNVLSRIKASNFKFETETMSLPIMFDLFRRESYYYCVLQIPSSPTEGLKMWTNTIRMIVTKIIDWFCKLSYRTNEWLSKQTGLDQFFLSQNVQFDAYILYENKASTKLQSYYDSTSTSTSNSGKFVKACDEDSDGLDSIEDKITPELLGQSQGTERLMVV